jgi:alkyl hydroperoxide reductase subunit AhpC
MKMNHPAPRVRVPALVGGTLTYLDLAHFKGGSIALCFLPEIGLLERAVLGYYMPHFEQEKAVVLGVVPEATFFQGPWQRGAWPTELILLSDPLGLLSRTYGVPRALPPGRYHGFVIDPDGLLRYHLVHDLNGRGVSALLEIVKACRTPGCPATSAREAAMGAAETHRTPILTTAKQGE